MDYRDRLMAFTQLVLQHVILIILYTRRSPNESSRFCVKAYSGHSVAL